MKQRDTLQAAREHLAKLEQEHKERARQIRALRNGIAAMEQFEQDRDDPESE